MSVLSDLYRPSLSLLTDLYQLTMAYGYWKSGVAETESVFHLFFRSNPFQGGYSIACGLGTALEYLQRFELALDDREYLQTLCGADGKRLFEPAFLDYLGQLRFCCDVDAIAEGTVVHPHEPLLRIKGPILQCQLVESPLLNLINFQTLIATKASRVCLAAAGDRVIEFGLRRAQGIDGALAASRAAFVGGCHGTSNVLAGKLYGIPVVGTHAHSWVMSFDDEFTAFQQYAQAMPNNCVFLVDTYDTLDGVRNAVEVGKQLRARGHELNGIRLDSGDLAWLSIEARRILDEGGFPQAKIVASNDLDERLISSLKTQGARIDTWGVGTKLVTAFDQAALGGVYKLGAIRDAENRWKYKLKLSEQSIKVSNPGILQVRRFLRNGQHAGDMIYDVERNPDFSTPLEMIDPADAMRRKTLAADLESLDLLQPVMRNGQPLEQAAPLSVLRDRAQTQLAQVPVFSKRFENPHTYPVGLERSLFDFKSALIDLTRKQQR